MIGASAIALLSVSLSGVPTFDLFGHEAPPTFGEEPDDLRFEKTAFFRALNEGPPNDACARVLATYFAALANAAPYFHKRDGDFYVDQRLLQILTRTASTPAFPGPTYLQLMARQVLIERKLPEPWMATAKGLVQRTGAPIDLARLELIADGFTRIDSFYFSLSAFIDRYKKEVALAPSLSQTTATQEFKDRYLDRDVAWGGLTLVDIQRLSPKKAASKPSKGKREEPAPSADEGESFEVAHLALIFPTSQMDQLAGRKGPEPVKISAKLAPKQYIDTAHAVLSRKYLVRGRLWGFAAGLQGIELTGAVLFEDPNWATWPGISTPPDVAACPASVNEMGNVSRPAAFRHEQTY